MEYYIIPLDHFEYENKEYLIEIEGKDSFNFFTNNILGDSILSSDFQAHFGFNFTNRIRKGSYIIQMLYSHGKLVKDEELVKKNNIAKNNLHLYHGMAEIFSISLWMIKDNSVNSLFSIFRDEQLPGGLQVIKDIMVSNSKGEYELVNFTHDEMINVNEWMNYLYNVFIEKQSDLRIYKDYNNLEHELEHNSNSFKRALTYLQQARNTTFLPAKIASYISILETLFVVSDSNTYKTPERTAIFLGGNLEQRKDTFKKVKDAYDIRSSYVHGSDLYNKYKNRLNEISFELDEVVRNVMINFFINHPDLNYSGDKSKIVNQYFLDLVIGGK